MKKREENEAQKIHHVFLMAHQAKSVQTQAAGRPSEPLGGRALQGPAAGEASPSIESFGEAMRERGYQVTVSRHPLESKRLLELVRPSLILLDPLVCADGVEFEMLGKLQTPTDPIPVLVLVDDVRDLRSLEQLPALFKDFLSKPFRVEELGQRLEMLLAAKRSYLDLQSHTRRLEGEVIRDFKTGLYTERHFRHLLRQEFQRAERHRAPLSFLLLDVDNFKTINDSTEYVFGDYVLTEFAGVLQRSVRDIDHPARFGGDEFMVLLPNTTPAEAVHVAARIRNQAARRILDNGRYQTRITVSIGVDTYDGRGLSSPEDLRRRANLALKEAKRRGKNRIWLYAGPEQLPREEGGGDAQGARAGAGGEGEASGVAPKPEGSGGGTATREGPTREGPTREEPTQGQ